MSYVRVIPRDLFNEASLLKCLGRLCLLAEGEPIEVDLTGDDFDITQSDDDGSIRAENIRITIAGVPYAHYRPLNSRDPWPLWVYPVTADWSDPIEVFDDHGNLSDELVNIFK